MKRLAPRNIRWLFSRELIRHGDGLPETTWMHSAVTATICMVAATLLRFVLDPSGVSLPYVLFFPAILLATLEGGIKGGSIGLFQSTFIAWFIFMEPRWELDISQTISLCLYVFSAGLIVAVTQIFRISVAAHHAALAREKTAVRARGDAERLATALVENAPVGLAVIGPDKAYVLANESFRQAGTRPDTRVAGADPRDSDQPSDRQIARLALDSIANKAAIEQDEVTFDDADAPGGRRSFLASAFPVFDASGALSFVGVTQVEITGRRRWEQVLQHREEHFRLAIAAASMGTWDYDFVARKGSCSPAAAAMHGLGQGGEMSAETIRPLFDHESWLAAQSSLQSALADGTMHFEYTIATGPAAGHRILSQGRLTRNAKGEPVRMVGIVRDVTVERSLAEKQRMQLYMLHDMANALPQLAWMSDDSGRAIWFNDRWYAFSGTSTQGGAALDDTWREAVHPADLPDFVAAWDQALAGNGFNDVEIRLRRHDGQWRPFLTRARAIYGTDGRVERWFGTCTDIAEIVDARESLARDRAELEKLVNERTADLRVANAELRLEAERRLEAEAKAMRAHRLDSLGQLTGGIAHDFKNYLAAILAATDMAARHAPTDGARAAEELETVKASVTKASALVRRLLAFARQQSLDPSLADANDIIRGIEPILRRTIGENIDIAISLSDAACPVRIDVTEMESALMNLAVNARDAMPDGGRLMLMTSRRDDGMIEIEVADTGMGMPESVRARVFEPFYTTKGGKGTGLGLAQVYGFIKQSGGDVELESTPGKGTIIRLMLPHSADLPTVSAPSVRSDRRPRVLIVEDEALLALSASDALDLAGYETTVAASIKDAEKALAGPDGFDACLIDVGLPDGRGDMLTRSIRARFPLCALILSTGYDRTDVPFPAGDVRLRFMNKPYVPSALPRAFAEMGVPGMTQG